MFIVAILQQSASYNQAAQYHRSKFLRNPKLAHILINPIPQASWRVKVTKIQPGKKRGKRLMSTEVLDSPIHSKQVVSTHRPTDRSILVRLSASRPINSKQVVSSALQIIALIEFIFLST